MTTRALEDKEIKAIFENISGTNATRNHAMLLLGIGMALRASELVGLKVAEVYDRGKVKTYVTIRGETAKYNKERTLRIGNGIQEEIAKYIDWKAEKRESTAPSAPLFRSQKGGHLTRVALFQIVKKIFLTAGIDQSPHCLRKTGATLYYIVSDYDLVATQQFLGHASPSTTRKYIGVATDKIVEYAQKLSLRLESAISLGKIEKLNRTDKKLNSIFSASTGDLVVELQARGIDMRSAIEQMQAKREKKAEIVEFPKF